MDVLTQTATLAAYELRNANSYIERRASEKKAREQSESLAVNFVKEHLEEYPDIKAAVNTYVHTFVEVLRENGGLLTDIQYDAYLRAARDAEEEVSRNKRIFGKLDSFSLSDSSIYVKANFSGFEYIAAKFTALTNEEGKPYQAQLESITQDPEVMNVYKQYSKQYTQTFKEYIEYAFAEEERAKEEKVEEMKGQIASEQPEPPKKNFLQKLFGL